MKWKWMCRRDRTNGAFWVAIMAAALTPVWSTPHVHHGRTWGLGVGVGVAVGLVAAALVLEWKRRCV